jgi:hypothetical protein
VNLAVFFLLSAVLGLALLSAIGLAIVSRLRRRSYPRSWWVVGSVVLVAGALWLDRLMIPSFDDGPFVGDECTSIPSRPPDQIFETVPGRLETFDPIESQAVPIVLRRRADGQVAWCIVTTVGRRTSVHRVRFNRVRPWVFGFVVDGVVDWTYGVERTRWLFWWTGGLRSYWFSW